MLVDRARAILRRLPRPRTALASWELFWRIFLACRRSEGELQSECPDGIKIHGLGGQRFAPTGNSSGVLLWRNTPECWCGL